MIEMVVTDVNKVNESATKVNSVVVRVDSGAQQLKEKEPRDEMVTNDGVGTQCINNPLHEN